MHGKYTRTFSNTKILRKSTEEHQNEIRGKKKSFPRKSNYFSAKRDLGKGEKGVVFTSQYFIYICSISSITYSTMVAKRKDEKE